MLLKTLSNALSLLDYFTPEQSSWGVRELAKVSHTHPAIVQRMLATFADQGFLRQDPHSKKYLVGLRLFELGQQVKVKLNLTDVIRPLTQRLAKDTEESVFLTVLDKTQGVCVDIAESANSIKYIVNVGTRYQLYAGSHTKVILAHMELSDQERILRLPCSPFRETYKDFLTVLDEIKAQGWCYSKGEYDKETFGVAVPLFSTDGSVIGSLGIAGPIFRFRLNFVEQQAAMLLNEQKTAQRALYNILFS